MKRKRGGMTRRSFLRHAAGAMALPAIVPSTAAGAGPYPAPGSRITMGCVGLGGISGFDMVSFLHQHDAQVVAGCDVNAAKRDSARRRIDNIYAERFGKAKYKGCAMYGDFRELIARDDIDAVVVMTPDHWHVPIALAAAKAGKDLYVEKPLGMSLAQDQALREAVERYGGVFQFGTQQRSDGRFRFACELARNERVGRVHTIRVGSPASGRGGSMTPAPVPKELDYDMWLGPAPWAVYTKDRCRTPYWYFHSDYALGFIAGWGIHHVDIGQWGNGTDLTGPVKVKGSGVFPDDGLSDTATSWRVELIYDNGVKMIFADNQQEKQGVVFEGTEGWVYVRRGFIDAQPKSLLKSVIGPDDIHLYESPGHHRNLLDCIRTRAKTVSPIEVAVRSDTICHISDIAIRTGRELTWDPGAEQFVGDPDANRMLTRSMREPWCLE